jgi:hypothetical protein
MLTGEGLPVVKDAALVLPAATPVSDQINGVWAGTVVARGRGRALAASTGRATQLGQVRGASDRGGAGRGTETRKLEGLSVVDAQPLYGASNLCCALMAGYRQYRMGSWPGRSSHGSRRRYSVTLLCRCDLLT